MTHTYHHTQRVLVSLLTCCIGIASLSIAARTSATSLSRESFQQRSIEKQWKDRQLRTEEFQQALKEHTNTVSNLHVQRTRQMQKRENNRLECADKIRRASKFTKLPITLECYQAELATTVEILERERSELLVVPGVSTDVRSIALTRIDLLIDAMNVIVNAINAGVYENIEELKEAKRSLRENYREPYWLARTRAHADILLSWSANMMTRIVETAEMTTLSEDEEEEFYATLECMEEAEQKLTSSTTAQDLEVAQSILIDVHSLMQNCTSDLRSAYIDRQQKKARAERKAIETAEQEFQQEKEHQESLLGRRLRRRLSGQYRVQGAYEHIEEEEVADVPEEEEVHSAPPPEPAKEPPLSRRLRRRLGEGYPVVGEQ